MANNYNQYPSVAIKEASNKLHDYGKIVKQETWQSVKSPDDTLELLNYVLTFPVPVDRIVLEKEVKPSLPWADHHFNERVSGKPVNPPPSSDYWPFNPGSSNFKKNQSYSHTYPERFWPKFAGGATRCLEGVRFKYGDLRDVIDLLVKYPHTRQAYIPIWFPEDTGVVHNERVPCTLGYHLIMRGGFMHLNYYIRSCDILRHFRDDIYLACRLLLYTIDEVLKQNKTRVLLPGMFNMYITSLHCFAKEREVLKKY